MMSCDSQCSLALPFGAMGKSTLRACGIPEHSHLLFKGQALICISMSAELLKAGQIY